MEVRLMGALSRLGIWAIQQQTLQFDDSFEKGRWIQMRAAEFQSYVRKHIVSSPTPAHPSHTHTHIYAGMKESAIVYLQVRWQRPEIEAFLSLRRTASHHNSIKIITSLKRKIQKKKKQVYLSLYICFKTLKKNYLIYSFTLYRTLKINLTK